MAPKNPHRDPQELKRLAWIKVAIAAAVIAVAFMAWVASDNVNHPNATSTQTSAQ
jgi:hypothetical protein